MAKNNVSEGFLSKKYTTFFWGDSGTFCHSTKKKKQAHIDYVMIGLLSSQYISMTNTSTEVQRDSNTEHQMNMYTCYMITERHNQTSETLNL